MQEEDGVEGEASDEAVEDERVVYFLEGSEDAREGAEEIVDDLKNLMSAKCDHRIVDLF